MIRRQIRLVRFGNGLGDRLTRILNRAERELRVDIALRLEAMARDPVRFGVTTTERLQRMNRAIAALNRPTFQDLGDLTREQLLELSKDEAAATRALIENQLPVVTSLDLPDASTLRSLVLSRPFEGRLLREWLRDLEVGDRRRMMDAIRIGLLRGESSTEIGRRVFGTLRLARTDGARNLTRRGAAAIANTAVSHVTNQAKRAVYLANRDIIPEELYVATLDARTTPICRSLDGKSFPVGEGPTPPVHVNCRSVRVPLVDGAVIGTRPATGATERQLQGLRGPERRRVVEQLTGRVPARTTYAEFLRGQTVSFQEEALGVTKAKLFRQGKLPLDRFVDQRGNELTLNELRQREPGAFQRAGIGSE